LLARAGIRLARDAPDLRHRSMAAWHAGCVQQARDMQIRTASDIPANSAAIRLPKRKMAAP
jgi:hypothetical protein